jgi:hypothetical protein
METVNIDKVQVYHMSVQDNPDSIRTTYVTYLCFTGDNGFYNARIGANELPPDKYLTLRSALGKPVKPAVHQQQEGKARGFALHSRECQGGMVFLNLAGEAKTVELPAGHDYYNSAGEKVTSITLDDKRADYVTFAKDAPAAMVTINPRRPMPVYKSLTLKLETPEPGAAIYYTLDGSEPTEKSLKYDGSLVLDKSATLKARAYVEGKAPSHLTQAKYTITDKQPAAEFYLDADSGTEFLQTRFPLVMLSHAADEEISVDYAVTGGTAAAGQDYVLEKGTVVFRPGEVYKRFLLKVTDDTDPEKDETVVIGLSNPKGATLASKTTFTHTIKDNDSGKQ